MRELSQGGGSLRMIGCRCYQAESEAHLSSTITLRHEYEPRVLTISGEGRMYVLE